MKTRFIETEFSYDGSQLKSLFAYQNYEILGDSIVSWVGPCKVLDEYMVDGEDRLAKAKICGDKMLHLIVEKFGVDLFAAVALQRLLTSIAKEILDHHSPALKRDQRSLRREGDDLYLGTKKLSISIATQSPTSSLIHFAFNISNEGTPVETLSLEDLEVSPQGFAESLMQAFAMEVEGVIEATQKVFWVK